jgi:ComF family protein
MFRELLQGIEQLAYPGICLACSKPNPVHRADFCWDCKLQLLDDPHDVCPRCASTVGRGVDISDGCVECRDAKFRFEKAVRFGPYDGLLSKCILLMKHPSGEPMAPIPLHWWRRLRRGFNQSEILARELARGLKIDCRPSWLRRIRWNPSQTTLTAAQRRESVKGIFRASRWAKFKDRHVLLIDDVSTTGSTANEATKAILLAGAATVTLAVLARA